MRPAPRQATWQERFKHSGAMIRVKSLGSPVESSISRQAPPSEIFRTVHLIPLAKANEIEAPLNVRCRMLLRLSMRAHYSVSNCGRMKWSEEFELKSIHDAQKPRAPVFAAAAVNARSSFALQGLFLGCPNVKSRAPVFA